MERCLLLHSVVSSDDDLRSVVVRAARAPGRTRPQPSVHDAWPSVDSAGAGLFSGKRHVPDVSGRRCRGRIREARAGGATFAYRLRAERWGQQRFALTDPAGTWVDVVEQTDPAPGFWEPYVVDETPW